MRGIDTNVLVRFMVQDDAEQAAKAAQFIATGCSVEEPCLVNRIVICELVRVLESAYGYPRDQVADVLERILRTAQLKIEDSDEAWTALSEYRRSADFSDALIAIGNLRSGCEYTATFDRKASRRAGFLTF
jgi:predicted nucleic-acid-binding protein